MKQPLEGHRGNIYIVKKDAKFWLLMVILALPHFNPPYLEEIGTAELIMNCWRVVSFGFILIWLIADQKRITPISIIIGIQQLFILFTTIMHKGAVYNCMATAFSNMSIVLLFDLAQDKKEVFLSSQLFCFEMAIYINLITEIIYPKGLYIPKITGSAGKIYWFLGYYNSYTKFYVPALVLAWLYYNATGKWRRSVFLTEAIFLSAILAGSRGVLVSLIVMAVAYAIFKNCVRIFNYYSFWFIHLLFFLLFIVGDFQNLFYWFINGVLDKWNSWLQRTIVWDRTMTLISDALILGHGMQERSFRITELGSRWAMHAHNMLLELLYQGGIINIILWTIIIAVAGKPVYQYRNTTESKIIAIGFLGWCIATLVEPFTTSFLMGMFVIAYRSNSVLK